MSISTVTNYFKKGTQLGWCEYDPKQAWYDSHTNLSRPNRDVFLEVIDMKDNKKYLFKHLKDFTDMSIQLTGKHIDRHKISKYIKKIGDCIDDLEGLKITRITKEEYLNGIRI